MAETTPEKMEAQLSKAQGKEKIPLLAELIKAHKQKNPQKAIEWGKEALELLDTFPDKKNRAIILNDMSHAYRDFGDRPRAKEYALESFALAEKIKDKPITAAALDSLGNISFLMGEFDQARKYYKRCSELYEELKDHNKLALALNAIAGISWEQGDYYTALEYLLQALAIYEKLKDRRGTSYINSNIGTVYRQLKDLDKSLEYYRKSLEIFKELDNKPAIALNHMNIGLVYHTQKNYEDALNEFDTAYKIIIEVGEKSTTGSILFNTGRVYKELKDNLKALEYFNQALKIKKKLSEKKEISALLINIASINQCLGKYQEAIEQATQGLDIALEIKVKEEASEAYLVLSETYEAMKNYREALNNFKKYKEKKDTILNEDTNRQINALRTNFDIQKRQKEIELLTKDKQNQRTVQVFLVLFAFLILLLAFVIYTRYRLKAKSNLALQTEIDERILTERKLRESEEKFRVLAEKSVVGIWIIQDNIIKYANPRSLHIFGYALEEMVEKKPLELVFAEDRPIVSEQLQERMTGANNTISYEYRGITRDGEVLNLESYGSLIQYQGEPALLESVIDITRRKKTDAELIKSRKMESIGILAGGIAHDFNNLLSVILGNTSMLKLSYDDVGPKFDNFLNNIEKASSQAADLAQKFITFSEGGWLMRKKVRFANILKDTLHLSPEIKNIPCEVSLPSNLDYIFGDERQLRQVMTNLLINAHEATSDNEKKIKIRAKNVTLDKNNSFSLKQGKYVKVLVIDNGKGIPADNLEKIFDPYFSTKNMVNQKGLGLGLAICYSIIKKHEGHIGITSDPKEGTTVELYLPVFSK